MNVLLKWMICAALAVVAGIAPWFFGAWEMWWFWPFAAVIALAIMGAGLQLALAGGKIATPEALIRRAVILAVLALPFFAYAIIRGYMSPVYMSAERSVLLHLTGIAVAAMTVFCLAPAQQRALFGLLFSSLTVMALYGVINHIAFGSRWVLWVPRYEQYAGRATGPYFCPDHFAGAMELLFCMSAGVLLDRTRRKAMPRWLAVLTGALAVAGIVLSQSRGAGLTLIVLGGSFLLWGFLQWPRPVRWYWRLVTTSGGLLLLLAGLFAFPAYKERYVTYAGLHQGPSVEGQSVIADVIEKLKRDSRGRMYGGAWRTWQSAPWMGVGPGMHQHLWPRFAATRDGNREQGIWPTQANEYFHSYEVHNDWLQLLEEYGIVGMLLFLIPLTALVLQLRWRCQAESRRWRDLSHAPSDGGYAYVLSGGLALVAMSFHSLGDFNLQMPGTVWILAVLLGLGGYTLASPAEEDYDLGQGEAGIGMRDES